MLNKALVKEIQVESDNKKDFVRILIRDMYMWQCVERLLKSYNFIFRGQSNSAWEVVSVAERNHIPPCDIYDNVSKFEQAFRKRERENSIEFKNRFCRFFKDRTEPRTEIGWLALMQHYGVPTRLLDFSHNVNIALYMCVTAGYNPIACGCSLYALNIKKISSIGNVCSSDDNAIEKFLKADIDSGYEINKNEPLIFLVEVDKEDKAPNWRIISQEGLFITSLKRHGRSSDVIAEKLIGESLVESLLRIPYGDSTGFPQEKTVDEIAACVHEKTCIEFVFPIGIAPLLCDLVKMRGISRENVYPDLGLVDTEHLKEGLDFENLYSPSLMIP